MAIQDQAAQNASLRFDPQQAAVQRRIDLTNQQTGIRNDAIGRMGELGRGYVGEAYNILDSSLGNNKTQAMAALDTAANQIGQGYRDANTMNEQLRSGASSRMQQLAQSIGAGNYALPALSGIESTALGLQEANNNRDATLTGNLRNWAAQSGDVYNRQIGMGSQMRADALSRLESELLQGVQENNLQGSEQVSGLNDELVRLLGERGAYLAEQLQYLSDQEFDKSIKQAQLDMQAQEINARTADSAADRSLRERAMAQEAEQANQMTDKEKLQLQMQSWGMQNDQLNADRDYGLESQRLRQAGEPDKLAIFNALSNWQNLDPGTGRPLGTVNPAAFDLLAEFGLIDREEPQSNVSVSGAQAGGLGGAIGRAGSPQSLRDAFNRVRPPAPPASSIGGRSALNIYPHVGTSMRFGS